MKTVYVSWTFLDTIEVEDDATIEEIDELVSLMDVPLDWNDREWTMAEGDPRRGR